MKHQKIKKGDLVVIKSAIDGSLLYSGGIGLVIEMSFGVPDAPDYIESRETCTLLWQGTVENNIDTEWLTKLSSYSRENVLAFGEHDIDKT